MIRFFAILVRKFRNTRISRGREQTLQDRRLSSRFYVSTLQCSVERVFLSGITRCRLAAVSEKIGETTSSVRYSLERIVTQPRRTSDQALLPSKRIFHAEGATKTLESRTKGNETAKTERAIREGTRDEREGRGSVKRDGGEGTDR